MSERYQHKEYGLSVPFDAPQTDEEFKRLLLLAREPSTTLTIPVATARRFAHLLPDDIKAQLDATD
jgi:hypothetical protein